MCYVPFKNEFQVNMFMWAILNISQHFMIVLLSYWFFCLPISQHFAFTVCFEKENNTVKPLMPFAFNKTLESELMRPDSAKC